jgi:hypothetical protein
MALLAAIREATEELRENKRDNEVQEPWYYIMIFVITLCFTPIVFATRLIHDAVYEQ